jgi:hypothetical protein
MQSDQRMNLSQAEGTVTAITDPTFYLPGKLASNSDGDYPGRLVKIALDPGHPWRYDRDGYVKTNEPIPMKQIVDVSPPIVTDRRTRENGNPSIETRVIDSPAPLTRGASKLPPARLDRRVRGHRPERPLQVQGRDEAGRVQSIYSDAHTASQAAAKFVRVRALEREMDKHRRRPRSGRRA